MAAKKGFRGKKKTSKIFPGDRYNHTKYLILRTIVMNQHTRVWTTRDLAERIGKSQSTVGHSCTLLVDKHYLHRDIVWTRQFRRVQWNYVFTLLPKGKKLYDSYEDRIQVLRCLGFPNSEYSIHLRQKIPNSLWMAGQAIHRIAHLSGGRDSSIQGRARDELYEKHRLEYFKDHPHIEGQVRLDMSDIIKGLPSWPSLEPLEDFGQAASTGK